jgi:peptide/nickel transport system substrate-binding protein
MDPQSPRPQSRERQAPDFGGSPGSRIGLERRALLRLAAATGLVAANGAAAIVSGCSPAADAAADLAAGRLNVAAVETPTTTDPMRSINNADDLFNTQHSGRLFRWKPVPLGELPKPGELEGELAESWSIDAGGITVRLRAARSPAGAMLGAEDVKWSFERAFAPEIADILSTRWLPITGIDPVAPVTALDPRTVRINCRPSALALEMLVPGHPPILDSTLAQSSSPSDDPWALTYLAGHSASYAPYQVSGFEKSQAIRLKANPNYWRGAPYFTEISVQAIPAASERLQLLMAGQAHFVADLDLAQFAIAKVAPDAISAAAMPNASMDFLFLQASRPPLDDPRVRQAISYALDRQSILAGPYRGLGGLPAGWCNHQTLAGQDLDLRHDLDKARALLAAAGRPNFELVLNALPSAGIGVDSQSLMLLMQDQLAQAGIKVNLQIQTSMAEYAAGLKNKRYDMWLQNSLDWLPSPISHFVDLHRFSRFGAVYGPEIDRLTAQIQTAADDGSAGPAIAALNAQYFEQMPIVPIMESRSVFAYAKGISGLQPAFKVFYYENLTADPRAARA